MNLELSPAEIDIQSRAREFAEKHLFTHEIECDENEGIPKKSLAKIRKVIATCKSSGVKCLPANCTAIPARFVR